MYFSGPQKPAACTTRPRRSPGKWVCIELSVSRSFMDEYMSALFLPHTDLNAFPTVQRELEERKRKRL
jgi:hypothetical protein